MDAKILTGPVLKLNEEMTVGQLFFNRAKKFSDRVCQVDASTNQHETFASLNQRSIRTALQMQQKGVTSKDIIITCSQMTLDAAVPILASFYLGAKVANLDPTLSVRQINHLLSIVPPKIIFVEEASVDLVEKSLKGLTASPEIIVYGKSKRYEQFSNFLVPQPKEQDFTPVCVDLEEISLMIFSSGCTGLPKAICHSHRSYTNLIYSLSHGVTKVDTIFSLTSFYWVSGVMMLGCSFLNGGRRIICARNVDGEKMYQIIEKYKVTFLFLAPILTYRLTNFPDHNKYDTSSVYTFCTAGTPMSTTQFRKISEIFRHSSLISAYGLTEVGMISMFHPINDQELIKRKIGSCGKIVANVSMKIVDLETNKSLGPNQKGEIRVQAPSIMKGYYNQKDSDIFDENNFLKTGDIGYYDEDNCLYTVERMKEMFKYLSWHIVPSSIEAVLTEHPAIAEAAVFGFPRNEEEGEVPTACVVLKNGCQVKKEEIEEFVAERVSDREKLRGGVFFLDKLIRTPSGKLMRREIRDYVVGICNNK